MKESVLQKFSQRALAAPNQIAVKVKDRECSYGELEITSNRIAGYLTSRGIGAGDVVGVMTPDSPESIAAILGVMKAGAAYSPLDIAYPASRLRLMCAQIDNMNLIICGDAQLDKLQSLEQQVQPIAELNECISNFDVCSSSAPVSSETICYVVFTSGTTGIPKAVAINHSGWSNLIEWFIDEHNLDQHSSNLLVSAFGFDITQRSIMVTLCSGATLHLMASHMFDPVAVNSQIVDNKVRVLHCAPSTLYLLVETEFREIQSLDYVFIGGESLNPDRVAAWIGRENNHCTLLHQYGVAECTDVATSYRIQDIRKYQGSSVPVGKPIRGLSIKILDDSLSPAPYGLTGEICIAGIGVGSGYIKNELANAKSFFVKSFGGVEQRYYRTGDYGKYQEDGNLVCFGRADNQVKIRGMRVDLGDIESALAKNDHIKTAVVVAIEDEIRGMTLVAYLVLKEGAKLCKSELKKNMADQVPVHMIPAEIVVKTSIPITVNGKIDRKKLEKEFQEFQSAEAIA